MSYLESPVATTPTFPRVPAFLRDFEEYRSDGARQMFAAMLITSLKDARAVAAGGNLPGEVTAEGLLEWATDMRKEIDRGGFRAGFLEALGSSEFLMNTHPGYPLKMMEAPEVTHEQAVQATTFEAACVEYAEGRRSDIPQAADLLQGCPPRLIRRCERLVAESALAAISHRHEALQATQTKE